MRTNYTVLSALWENETSGDTMEEGETDHQEGLTLLDVAKAASFWPLFVLHSLQPTWALQPKIILRHRLVPRPMITSPCSPSRMPLLESLCGHHGTAR
jgi:hypothetical protein